jgi:serpin B
MEKLIASRLCLWYTVIGHRTTIAEGRRHTRAQTISGQGAIPVGHRLFASLLQCGGSGPRRLGAAGSRFNHERGCSMRGQTVLQRCLATIVILSLFVGCVSCRATQRSNKPRLESDASDAEMSELVAGNSAFAFDLYRTLCQEEEGNLFYSPYSISSALAMTYGGARGETERQMAATMHYALPQERLHPAFNALDVALTGQGKDTFQLHIANAIWGQAGYEFLPAYLDLLAENYGAGLRTLDFARKPGAARQTINDWVSEQTEEKIQDLIPEGMLGAMVRLVLTNAIYFKGKWVFPFEEGDTRDDPFTLLDGDKVTVDMMYQENSFAYAEGDGYQAVQLPYRDSSMAMLFVLPDIDRFQEFEAALSSDFVDAVTEDLASETVRLWVPKYSFESAFSLVKTLQQMRMPAAFDASADFSGMTGNRDLYISNVVHKAFVAVDEEGTEAAAATAVVVVEKEGGGALEYVVMRLDHPFLFLIRDVRSGTVLFVGRVLNPKA